MNDIVKTLLNHKYKDESMKKYVFILKRSKSKRIKNKAFGKLFASYLKDVPMSIIGGDIVLMSKEKFVELTDALHSYTNTLEGLYDEGVSHLNDLFKRIGREVI